MSRRRDSSKRTRPDDESGGAFWGELAAIARVILTAIAGILVAGLAFFFMYFVF